MIEKDKLQKLIEYSKTLKVLYVEDSLEAREQALKLLENFFTNMVVAVNGQDGLDKFKTQEFDLIFTDLNMPVMNGMDMIKNIRLVNDDVSIVVISAHNEQSFQDDAKRYNVEKYIIKPVRLDMVIDILLEFQDNR